MLCSLASEGRCEAFWCLFDFNAPICLKYFQKHTRLSFNIGYSFSKIPKYKCFTFSGIDDGHTFDKYVQGPAWPAEVLRSTADQILQLQFLDLPHSTSRAPTFSLDSQSRYTTNILIDTASTHPCFVKSSQPLRRRDSRARSRPQPSRPKSATNQHGAFLYVTTSNIALDPPQQRKLIHALLRIPPSSPVTPAYSPPHPQPASPPPQSSTTPLPSASPPTNMQLLMNIQEMIPIANIRLSDNGPQTCRSSRRSTSSDLSVNTAGVRRWSMRGQSSLRWLPWPSGLSLDVCYLKNWNWSILVTDVEVLVVAVYAILFMNWDTKGTPFDGVSASLFFTRPIWNIGWQGELWTNYGSLI